ncbi:MAG TPA: SRPBCC family protein [Polyangiaceae bacterium]|nr:SRPBCC family protein [Polyangiaceae bacterium]
MAFFVPHPHEAESPLAGDDLLPDAAAQVTHELTVEAAPEAFWPLLVEASGVLPVSADRVDDLEVLRIEADRTLVLGCLHDTETGAQLSFFDPRPRSFWQTTWTLSLEPIGPDRTQLHVRGRVAFSRDQWLDALWLRPVHPALQKSRLQELALRAEGKLGETGGAAQDGAVRRLDLTAPSLAGVRGHWGVDRGTAEREYPGDSLVPLPDWSWTHGIEIAAPPEEVWKCVSRIGQLGEPVSGYRWLEEFVPAASAGEPRPEPTLRRGDVLVLHPAMPVVPVAAVQPGRWFVAHLPGDSEGLRGGAASWLFHLEPLPNGNTLFVSRFRALGEPEFQSGLGFGPYVTESIGYVLDRRMLLGVKDRTEQRTRNTPLPPVLRGETDVGSGPQPQRNW